MLNYRTPALVIDCLETLVPEVAAHAGEIVVVDNASGDGSAARIRSACEANGWVAVQVLEAAANRGFAAGNNLGIDAVRADAYLLLNSDTLVRPGALGSLLAALAADPRLGLVGPRLEGRDGTPLVSCFRRPSPAGEVVAAAHTGPLERLLAAWVVPMPPSDEPREPDWTSFAAVLVRGAAIREIGPLDEHFFMYYEDVDYCARLRAAGWRVGHEPGARIVHLIGGTSQVDALRESGLLRPDYFYAARRHYFRKTAGRAGLLAANLGWTLGWLVGWIRDRFGRRPVRTIPGELRKVWSAP